MSENKENSYSETVEQITGFFTDYFKKLGKLPSGDKSVEEIMNDIHVASELKRILAIPDRLSYLAKGIISTTVRDEAEDAVSNFVCIIRALLSSSANEESVDRSIKSITNSELDNLLKILGLTVESEGEDVTMERNNRVKLIGDKNE